MMVREYNGPWYHGSPERLEILRKGSWVTQFKEIAKAFSHKPSRMSLADDCGTVKHNGSFPGFLYTIDEDLGPEDIVELSGTCHTHWETQRDLWFNLVAELAVSDPPLLIDEEISRMKREHPDIGSSTGFIGEESRNAEPDAPADAEKPRR